MFQVLWVGMPDIHVTWELAASLPSKAIEEYEKGLLCEPVKESSNNYGRQTCTITVAPQEPGRAKKPRTDRLLVGDTGG